MCAKRIYGPLQKSMCVKRIYDPVQKSLYVKRIYDLLQNLCVSNVFMTLSKIYDETFCKSY